MKNFFLLALGLGLTSLAWSQNCPYLQFTYDVTGNRTQSLYTTVYCGPPIIVNRKPIQKDSLNASLIVKAYPNPVTNLLNLDLGESETPMESLIFIYDLMGRKVYSGATTSDHFEIDMVNVSEGSYFLNIVQGSKHKTLIISKNQ